MVAVYLLWMASSSLSGKRGEPGWVHRRERGSGSIGTFKLRCMPARFMTFINCLRTSQIILRAKAVHHPRERKGRGIWSSLKTGVSMMYRLWEETVFNGMFSLKS